MTNLLLIKEMVKNFIGKYEIYLKPLGKFLLALITFMMIGKNTGYMEKATNPSIIMILALMCSFMPTNFILVCAGLLLLLHFYALSMECALVALVLFLILLLLYFRFASLDTLVVLLLPMCFALKIPYVIPVCVGLLCSPASAVSVIVGTVVYYVIHYITGNVSAISSMEAQDLSGRFRFVVDGLLNNKTMIVMAVVFAITVIIVYTIRRLPIAYSWTFAIVGGLVLQMLMLFVGSLKVDADVSIVGVLFGSIVSAGICKVVEFMEFHVDYTRTENVQFEDDDYYYYVKAVPKINLTKTAKTVKKINAQKKKRAAKRPVE